MYWYINESVNRMKYNSSMSMKEQWMFGTVEQNRRECFQATVINI